MLSSLSMFVAMENERETLDAYEERARLERGINRFTNCGGCGRLILSGQDCKHEGSE